MKYPRLGEEGRVFRPSTQPTEVTILGGGASKILFAQQRWEDPNWGGEVWAINFCAAAFRHDLAFNMHDLEALKAHEAKASDFLKFYANHDRPLVTIRALPELPNSYEYPLGEIIDAFGDSYFAGAPGYMIALAMWMGVKRINCFGLDYNYPNRLDYEAGRANTEYWLGRAAQSGVQVAVPDLSTLCDQVWRVGDKKGQQGYGKVYGYFDRQPIFTNGKLTGFVPGYAEIEDALS